MQCAKMSKFIFKYIIIVYSTTVEQGWIAVKESQNEFVKLKVHDDGNCFYRCIAKWKFSDEINALINLFN